MDPVRAFEPVACLSRRRASRSGELAAEQAAPFDHRPDDRIPVAPDLLRLLHHEPGDDDRRLAVIASGRARYPAILEHVPFRVAAHMRRADREHDAGYTGLADRHRAHHAWLDIRIDR